MPKGARRIGYDKSEQRQVNTGNLLLRGVPGVGKTFFGVILAAIAWGRRPGLVL